MTYGHRLHNKSYIGLSGLYLMKAVTFFMFCVFLLWNIWRPRPFATIWSQHNTKKKPEPYHIQIYTVHCEIRLFYRFQESKLYIFVHIWIFRFAEYSVMCELVIRLGIGGGGGMGVNWSIISVRCQFLWPSSIYGNLIIVFCVLHRTYPAWILTRNVYIWTSIVHREMVLTRNRNRATLCERIRMQLTVYWQTIRDAKLHTNPTQKTNRENVRQSALILFARNNFYRKYFTNFRWCYIWFYVWQKLNSSGLVCFCSGYNVIVKPFFYNFHQI